MKFLLAMKEKCEKREMQTCEKPAFPIGENVLCY